MEPHQRNERPIHFTSTKSTPSRQGNNNQEYSFSFSIDKSSQSSKQTNDDTLVNDDDMAGYHFLKRSNAMRLVLNDDESSCNTSSTVNVTDSESSVYDIDNDSTMSPDGSKCTTHTFGQARNRTTIVYDRKIASDGLYRNFEDFIRSQMEKYERRYGRGQHQRKQNMSLLFSCTDKINFDFIHAVKVYSEKPKRNDEVNIRSGSSAITERFDNTTTGRITKDTTADSALVDDEEINSYLFAATHIVQQFLNVVGTCRRIDTVNTNHSDYLEKSPLQVIYGDMEKYLQTHLSLVGMSDITSLSPVQATKFVRWYRTYVEQIEEIPSLSISPLWKNDTERLLHHYLEKAVRKVMTELGERMDQSDYIDDTEQDICENDMGYVITRLPEEIMHVIDIQVQVAMEYLQRTEFIVQVFQTCLEIIFNFVGTKMVQLQTQWQRISTKRYCSIINNVTRLSDQLEDYRTSLEQRCSSTTGICTDTFNYWQPVDETIDTLVCELAQLAMLTTDHLCRHILHRLENPDPIINMIGSRSWEDDSSNNAVEETVESLQEYFTSIEQWLCSADYFLPKILQKCFYLTIQSYVESFYSNTLVNGIRQPDVVSVRLKNDYAIFTEYFNGSYFEVQTRRHGSRNDQTSLFNARLSILLSMSRIMDPEIPPSDLVDDTRNVLEHIVSDNSDKAPAILHLVGLRGGIRSRDDSIQWVQDITRAEQMIRESTKKHETATSTEATAKCIRLPDLRNSPYIYTVRINQKDIEREFSIGSRDFAQATKDMVTGVGYTKQVQMYLVRKQPKVSFSPLVQKATAKDDDLTTPDATNIAVTTPTKTATAITADSILDGIRSRSREIIKNNVFRQRKPDESTMSPNDED